MLQERFHALDGYALDAQVGGVLTGLGFGKEDWARQTDEFSGGWQMRIALAKLLLAKPNLLLLDEPTNHLDLGNPQLARRLSQDLSLRLHSYLARPLLSGCNDRPHGGDMEQAAQYLSGKLHQVSEPEGRAAHAVTGGLPQSAEQIEHLEAFINRFRAQATKAKQVQSRIKELEKIERIEIPEEEPVIHFKFPQPPPSGRMVVEAEGLSKSYGAKQVLGGVNFTIERGDRVALVGVNGAGKSTLIKLLTGVEKRLPLARSALATTC